MINGFYTLQMSEYILLSQELEEVSKQLIKAKMASVTRDKTHSSTGKEQRNQQLHQKVNMVKDNQEIEFFLCEPRNYHPSHQNNSLPENQ